MELCGFSTKYNSFSSLAEKRDTSKKVRAGKFDHGA